MGLTRLSYDSPGLIHIFSRFLRYKLGLGLGSSSLGQQAVVINLFNEHLLLNDYVPRLEDKNEPTLKSRSLPGKPSCLGLYV